MRGTCALVVTLADHDAAGIDDDSAHSRVGVSLGSFGRELEGTAHQRDIALPPCCVDLTVVHVLPFALGSCSGELRGANGGVRPWQRKRNRWVNAAPVHALSDSPSGGPDSANDVKSPRLTCRRPPGSGKRASLLLPLIRTFTVGPGVSPGSPTAGCGRVADFNRRFGITPITEHVPSVCHRRCEVPVNGLSNHS